MPETPAVFSERFPALPDKQTQWQAFQRRIGVAEGLAFTEALATIKEFLAPVYGALYSKSNFSGQWDSKKRAWQDQQFC
jgi:hypothetical protein